MVVALTGLLYKIMKKITDTELIIILLIILVLATCSKSKAQSPIKVWHDMGDFNQHRTVSTAIAWTGTIFACKATGNCQWKGAVIGGGISLGIGGLKEGVWDGLMRKGVPSWKDFGADCLGTAVGTMAGVMCNGLAQHIRDKREYERSLKFTDPFEVVDVQVKEVDLEVKETLIIDNTNN